MVSVAGSLGHAELHPELVLESFAGFASPKLAFGMIGVRYQDALVVEYFVEYGRAMFEVGEFQD